jgi:hypothetical protein
MKAKTYDIETIIPYLKSGLRQFLIEHVSWTGDDAYAAIVQFEMRPGGFLDVRFTIPEKNEDRRTKWLSLTDTSSAP